MAVLRNTAEGQTNGTALTTGNSGGGSGDAFDQLVTIGTVTTVYSTDRAVQGTQSYKVTPSVSSALFLMYDETASSSAAIQMSIYLPSYPTTNQSLLMMRSSGATVCELSVDETGSINIDDSIGSFISASSSGIFPLNSWVILDMYAVPGATTSTGQIKAKLTRNGYSTPLWSYDSGTTVNAGTNPIVNYRLGKLDSTPNMPTFYVDNLTIDTSATSFIPITPATSASAAWLVA